MTGERPAEPGEVCTCGRPAVIVHTDGRFGDTGYCGRERPADEPCPWCLAAVHTGRCPAYRLRPVPGDVSRQGVRERVTEGRAAGQRYRVREITATVVESLDASGTWTALHEPAASDVAAYLADPPVPRWSRGDDLCQCGHRLDEHERQGFPAWPCTVCECGEFRADDRTGHERSGDPS